MRPVGTPGELERRRRRAVALLKDQKNADTVAEMIGCHVRSVFRWKAMAEEGLEMLAAVPHPGPQPKLSDKDLLKLEKLLMKSPLEFGWTTEIWTLPRVTTVIRKELGVKYDPSQVCRILRHRLGWSNQKPERRARERKEDVIEKWRKEEFPQIKKSR